MTESRTPDPRTVLSPAALASAHANVVNAPPLTPAQLDIVARVLSPSLRTLLTR